MAGRHPCPKCDFAVPVGARECPECGARIGKRSRDDDEDRPRSRDRVRPRIKRRNKAHPFQKFLVPAIIGLGVLFAGLVVGVLWATGVFSRARTSDPPPGPDRTRAAVNNFEPVAWTVPDGAAPVQDWPANIVLPATKAVSFPPGPKLAFLAVRVEEDKSRLSHRDVLVAGELDPATGQPLPNVRRLDPRLIVKNQNPVMTLPPASVNSAGTLATRGVEPGSVDFHAPDGTKTTARFGANPIDWLLWADDSTLLVLTGKQLIGWDVPGNRARFTAGNEYQLPAAASPARNWVAVSVGGKYLDLVDAKTGTCKGRIGGEGNWRALAVSPSGRRLAGVRSHAAHGGAHEVHAWDLKTGNRTGVIQALATGSSMALRWANPSELYLASDEAGLYDMEHHVLLGRIAAGKDLLPRRPLNDGPDGRAWAQVDYTIRGQIVVAPVDTPKPPGSLAFRPGVGVRVEVDCGDDTRTKRAKATITDMFKEEGYLIGGDWVMKVSAAQYDTNTVLTLLGAQVKVPGVKGTIQLVDPEGKEVATATHNASFPQRGSRYYKQTKTGQFVAGPNPGAPQTDLYDFEGRDPKTAMAEETWDVFLKTLESARLPRGAWKTEAGYVPLPLQLEYR